MEKIDLSKRFHHPQEPDRLEEYLNKHKVLRAMTFVLFVLSVYVIMLVTMDGHVGDSIINHIQHLF